MNQPLRRHRPGPRPLGKTPGAERGEALLKVLEEAVQQTGRRAFLVLTHKGPDPDALGACVGLAGGLAQLLEADFRVATSGRIFRAENLAMVRELGLFFDELGNVDAARFAGGLLVDSQPGFGHTQIPTGLPVLAVIDHHRGSEDRSAAAGVRHRDVRDGVGSTSAIVWEYLQGLGVQLDARMATALFCGVRYDTGDLSQNVSALDEQAYFELFRQADRPMLARIQRPRLPQEYFKELQRSLRLARRQGPAVVALLGQVVNPESVAEMADFFLRLEGVHWTLVGGAYEGQYYVSLRTRLAELEAYPLLDRLLGGQGSFGGHGSVAGGRIGLDSGSQPALRTVERRLRTRVLEVIDPGGTLDEEARLGRPLT
jgi:nanoRNase/pAp phosphatase (c-di-AMP/oligoRNAs hydrolase)